MDKSQGNQLSSRVESLWKYSGDLYQSVNLLRFIGYLLLLLASLDFILIFVPPNFTQPAWEFGLVGQIVERVAVPLIGLGLVFMGQLVNRRKWERFLLPTLSWLALVVAVLFIFLIPLNVVSAVRIDRQSGRQITAQVKSATSQLQDAKTQIDDISTIEQAEQLLGQLDPQAQASNVQENQTLPELKEDLVTSLNRGEQELKTQAKSAQKNQRQGLVRNSIKWDLGAVISSALFFGIWRGTGWARKK